MREIHWGKDWGGQQRQMFLSGIIEWNYCLHSKPNGEFPCSLVYVVCHFENLAFQPKVLFFPVTVSKVKPFTSWFASISQWHQWMLREVFVLAERWITTRASYSARTHTLLQTLVLGDFSFWEPLRDCFRRWMGVQSCLKKVFPMERLCHSCERWCVAVIICALRNKLRISERELITASYLCRGVCSSSTVWVAWFSCCSQGKGE